MTWAEIKRAVEQADVKDDEEICIIQCENGRGDKTFHTMRLGRALKLTENSQPRENQANGCAI